MNDSERAVIPAKPSAWQPEGEAREADGVTEGWIRFETAVARGCGHVRLIGGRAWTLLTTMTELKGFEEKKGADRVKGAEHGVQPGRKSWLERKTEEEGRRGMAGRKLGCPGESKPRCGGEHARMVRESIA